MKKSLMFILLFATPAFAHQPVMDMAPRWKGGYGFQVRYESFGDDELYRGDSKIDNPLGLERYVERTWLEGIYTFDRSKRVTFKVPYVNQRRIKNFDGQAQRQNNEGFGDLVLGVPLKYYTNHEGRTSNLSMTPSFRFPTGSTSGEFPISDGSWDPGISLSYSAENPLFYQMYDLFYWLNTDGNGNSSEGDELGLDINLGVHPYHDPDDFSGVYLMLDITARHNESGDALTTGGDGGERVHAGPILVVYRENIMFRAEYLFPLYENLDGEALSRGEELNVGIGFTF